MTASLKLEERVWNVLFSRIVGVLLLSPTCLIIPAIELKRPGDPSCIQERIGKNGKTISILKLRTMRKGADHLEQMGMPECMAEKTKLAV